MNSQSAPSFRRKALPNAKSGPQKRTSGCNNAAWSMLFRQIWGPLRYELVLPELEFAKLLLLPVWIADSGPAEALPHPTG